MLTDRFNYSILYFVRILEPFLNFIRVFYNSGIFDNDCSVLVSHFSLLSELSFLLQSGKVEIHVTDYSVFDDWLHDDLLKEIQN